MSLIWSCFVAGLVGCMCVQKLSVFGAPVGKSSSTTAKPSILVGTPVNLTSEEWRASEFRWLNDTAMPLTRDGGGGSHGYAFGGYRPYQSYSYNPYAGRVSGAGGLLGGLGGLMGGGFGYAAPYGGGYGGGYYGRGGISRGN